MAIADNWYHVALWFGQGGGGKTTGMVRDLVMELENGSMYKRAYTNIDVRHPDVERVKFEELKDIRADLKDGRPTALLCLDQLHKYLDSRQSLSPRNVYMSNIVIELRQHGLSLRGTTWARSSIDLRARRFNELQILCERGTRGFKYTMVDANSNRIRTLPIIPYENCEKYWSLFDMNELVEDIDPRWDPRMSPTPPGAGKRGRKKEA